MTTFHFPLGTLSSKPISSQASLGQYFSWVLQNEYSVRLEGVSSIESKTQEERT